MFQHWIVRDRDVARSLDNLIGLLSPVGATAFLGAHMGPYLSRRAKERFESEGDDVSGVWAPLKPVTIQMRHAQGFEAGPINRRTGELENWVVRGGWNAYPTALGASMQYPAKKPAGELRKKVQTAQKGKEYPNTVARPVLGVNEADLIFFQTSLMFAVGEAMR
ncbi:MAG: head-to-tail connector protein [Phage AS32]|nr:MAG: head-to-tail connector protein [Phage AS32]